jgi:hypothetical protein
VLDSTKPSNPFLPYWMKIRRPIDELSRDESRKLAISSTRLRSR